jgi:FtsP/CotA-like multicopper oxidase with cupredoxin domain
MIVQYMLIVAFLGLTAAALRTLEVLDGGSIILSFADVNATVGNMTTRGYAYGGSIPGPTIATTENATIAVVLENLSEMATTLHPHGVRLANRFDGVPGLTQPAIKPGQNFTYNTHFPDPGIYWYHPHVMDWHVRGKGAYGVFLVRPRDENYYNPVNREEVLILADTDPASDELPDSPSFVLMGRFGDVILINGATDYKLQVDRGEVVRFFILNAADVRPFNIAFGCGNMKMIGSDIGKGERDVMTDTVLISPAEWYIVEVLFSESGECALFSKTPSRNITLGSVSVSDVQPDEDHSQRFPTITENAVMKTELDLLRPHFNKPVDRVLVMTLSMMNANPPTTATDGPVMHHGPTPDPSTTSTTSPHHGPAPGAPEPTSTEAAQHHGSANGTPEPTTTAAAQHHESAHGAPEPTTTDAAHHHGLMPANPEMSGAANLSLWKRTANIEWEDMMPAINRDSNLTNVLWKLVDLNTGRTNAEIDWSFTQGDIVKVELINDENASHPMQHPIHFHGQRMLVLSINGEANPSLQWKDTVLTRPGERIQVLLEVSNPGLWMFHCHIARHNVESGAMTTMMTMMTMMGYFSVAPRSIAEQCYQAPLMWATSDPEEQP